MSTANVNENRLIIAAPLAPSIPAAPSIITRNGIQFEKYVITKDDNLVGKDLAGCLAITKDKKHKGFLHLLIFIGQIFSSIISGRWQLTSRDDLDLCHAQVILGVNTKEGKEGHLILAHGVFKGISTTCEDHTKDDIITQIVVYRPIDKKIRKLFAENAKLTAVNYRAELAKKIVELNPVDGEAINTRLSNVLTDDDKKKIKVAKAELRGQDQLQDKLVEKYALDGEKICKKLNNPPNNADKKALAKAEKAVKAEMPQFSISKMLFGAFKIQKTNTSDKAKTRAAYAAADILLGRKLHDEKDRLATYFCSAYMMTLTQGSTLISGLTPEEIETSKSKTRDEIKDGILARINNGDDGDALKKIYNDNAFMQVDAHHTLSYFTGQLLNRNAISKEFSELPTTA